jgi:hypothetical protein
MASFFLRFLNHGLQGPHGFYPLEKARIRMPTVTALFCTSFRSVRASLAPPFEVAARLEAMRGRIARPKRFRPRRAGSAEFSKIYVPLRTALNVPCFDGRSPTDGENSTSPEIKSAFSNFPLQVNVPASRPTFPSINSTGAEKLTESLSTLHLASKDVGAPQTFARGSSNSKVPFPSACASKRIERCSAFPKVISTFHMPVMLGVCA